MARAKTSGTQPPPQNRAEFDRRRRNRNLALGGLLAGVVLLFYILSIVRLGLR